MKTSLLDLFILFIKIRNSKVNKGSTNSVKIILIENIVGKGRIGNSYIPFPTKYRSEYVPNKEASKMAGKYDYLRYKKIVFLAIAASSRFSSVSQYSPTISTLVVAFSSLRYSIMFQ